MNKKTRILLIVGGLCFGFGLALGTLLEQWEDLKDFILGLGTAFFISALIIQTGKKDDTRTKQDS